MQRTRSGSSRGHTESDEFLDTIPDPFVQNLFVLCHGEQVNYVDGQSGAAKGMRPWDSPLTERGKLQARRVGREIRLEDWNVTRVVMAPSLRCVQTAVEVISGMCMLPSSVNDCSNGSPWISTIKVWNLLLQPHPQVKHLWVPNLSIFMFCVSMKFDTLDTRMFHFSGARF